MLHVYLQIATIGILVAVLVFTGIADARTVRARVEEDDNTLRA